MMNLARRLLPLAAVLRKKIPTTAQRYHHRAAAPAPQPPAIVIRPSTSQYCSPPWYRNARKVTTAAAGTALLLAAAAGASLAATCRLERVPCSNRVHVVILSRHHRKLVESQSTEEKSESEFVDPQHPDSVRVRRIAERVLHAAYRGLGVDGGRDAVMLRRGAAATAGRKQARYSSWWTTRTYVQPQTEHLGGGIEWEVLLREDDDVGLIGILGSIIVNTGLLEHFKTDAEIAFCLAHEIGHAIARHEFQITTRIPVPGIRLPFSRRGELEADYIGTLLLGAAGFDPRNAFVVLNKLARVTPAETVGERIASHWPSYKKRLERLSQPKVMEEAWELYREVIAMETVTDRYFSSPRPSIAS